MLDTFNGSILLLVDYLLVNVGTIRLVVSVFVTDMIHKIYSLLENIDVWLLSLCSLHFLLNKTIRILDLWTFWLWASLMKVIIQTTLVWFNHVVMNWENLCLYLVTCDMIVQSAIFYITKIVDSATFVNTVFHVIWYLSIKF